MIGLVKFAVFALFLISADAVASSLQNEGNVDELCAEYKDALSKLILKFLEKLRPEMSTGIPSLGIPPLDPLQIQDTSFSISKSFQYDITGRISKSTMQGLQAFNVTGISTSFMRLQANVSVAIPFLSIKGLYKMKGKLVRVIPVSGAGPYKLSPADVTTYIRTHLKLEHNHLQVTNMDFSLDMAKLYVKFDGLMGGGTVGNFINSILNKFGLRLFHKIEPRVHDKLRAALITEINEKLKNIPIFEFIEVFKPECKRAIERDLLGKDGKD